MDTENKYKNIDMVDIEDYENVFDLIGDALFKLNPEFDYIAVYSKRNLISFLLTEMIKDKFTVGYANFDAVDEACSNDIYLLLVRSDGTISIEPGISNSGKVLEHDAKIALIDMDNCPQSVVDYNVKSDKEVVLFGEPDDEDASDISKDNKGNKKDSKSTYTITIEADLDDTKVKEKLDAMEKEIFEFNDRMDKAFRSNILRNCEIINEMNEFAKLLW